MLTEGADGSGAAKPVDGVGSWAATEPAARNKNTIPRTAFVPIIDDLLLQYRRLDAHDMVFRFIVLRLPSSDMKASAKLPQRQLDIN
jgi:hypothetical protein